jgi:hypothetical protein
VKIEKEELLKNIVNSRIHRGAVNPNKNAHYSLAALKTPDE